MSELIIGFEHTGMRRNKFGELYPNGWPIEDEELYNFLLEHHEKNNLWWIGNLDFHANSKDFIIERIKNYRTLYIVDENIVDQHGVFLEQVKIMNVSEILNQKYIFPFVIPTAAFFTFRWFLEKGIYLSDKVKNDCRNGFCKILISQIEEGDGDQHRTIFNFIKHQAEFHDIPLNSFAFLDGNMLTPKLYDALGIKGFQKTYWERSSNFLSSEEFEKRIFNFINNDEKQFYFLSLNRRSRLHRTVVTSEIFNKWNDKFLWSFLEKFNFSLELFDDINFAPRYPEDYLFKRKEINFTKDYYNSLPKIIDYETSVNDHSLRLNLQEQAYINLVTETKFFEPDSIFLTEKIFKPIVGMQPFIVVGSCNILKTLRDDGYQTFHPFINEEYDNIENNEERMKAIFREINRISELKKTDLARLIKKLATRCIHNYKHWKHLKTSHYRDLKLVQDLKNWLNQ